MKFEIRISTIIILSIISISVNTYEKCCKSSYRIVERNGTYLCETDQNERLEDNFENDGFFDQNKNGTCLQIDFLNEIHNFSVDSATKIVLKLQDVKKNYFQKCCPLGSKYNENLHSCTEKNYNIDLKKYLKNDSFIRIGVPDCEIVLDKILRLNENIKLDEDGLILDGKTYRKGKFCIDRTLNEELLVRLCEKNYEICDTVRCINKCCPDGQSYVNGTKCRNTFVYGVDLHSFSNVDEPDVDFALTYGITPPLIGVPSKSHNNLKIIKDGIIFYNNSTGKFDNFHVKEKEYCIEHISKKGENKYSIFVKIMPLTLDVESTMLRWVELSSCIFLIFTVAVYSLLPNLRNLFGKILLSYSIVTFLHYSILVYYKFVNQINDFMCKILGYFSVTLYLWSFTWMHIMCIDIWFSLGSARTLHWPQQRNEWKRFLQYSLYGWGFPIIWTLGIFIFSVTNVIPKYIKPTVGVRNCFLEFYRTENGNYAYLVFITFPLLMQQIINVVLYVKTINYCLGIENELGRIKDPGRSEFDNVKKRWRLIIKLAIVMGISFLVEIIFPIYSSKSSVTKTIQTVGDAVNGSQGVFIFIIFIFKKKVYNSILRKIKTFHSTSTSGISVSATQLSLQNFQ